MENSDFTFTDDDGVEIFVYKWVSDGGDKPKGAIQIIHGLGEYGARYGYFAEKLVAAGFIVYADDHRGHGKTAKNPEELGDLGPRGWVGAVDSIKKLTSVIKEENPGVPVFLFAHSWGSFIGQNLIEDQGSVYAGVILCGTKGQQPMLGPLKIIAKLFARVRGKNRRLKIMDNLTMAPLNKMHKPARTTHDWLTRDEKIVDKYLADPLCGFLMPTVYWIEFAEGLKKIWTLSNQEKIPKDLPLHLITGAADASNEYTENFDVLVKKYEDLGLNATSKKYEGGRHEILNELNKDEIIADIIAWYKNILK